MSGKTRHLRGRLAQVSSQRVEYKPYGYVLGFDATVSSKDPKTGELLPVSSVVFVEIDIPEEEVREAGPGFVVVGLSGLNAILQVTADSLDELNKAHLKKLQGGS